MMGNYYNARIIKSPKGYLSELMATNYRHLHRVLSDLCEKKILRKEGRTYKLRKMSNESISYF
jgi:hypothetical protein